MWEKIKKITLYMQVLYRGELLKRIEYKIKDFLGYFYLRNKIQIQEKKVEFFNDNINIDFSTINDKEIDHEKYKIFNKSCNLEDIIEKLNTKEVFWRKTKLKEYEEIKVLWEYNRLQILLPLAIKYLKTKQESYKKDFDNILSFWEEHNRFEYTINWNSNLEVAIRAINMALALLFLQDEEMQCKYKKLLYLHAKHINSEINYTKYCIPNNHLIGEATALLLLSKILKVKENKKWYKKAINILLKSSNVIDEYGVSKENSFSYQFFVTKMYILALCFINENEKFEHINKKIIKSLSVLKYTVINENKVLNYGDNDDGFLFSIDRNYNLAKDIEQYYNLFFKNEHKQETTLYIELLEIFNPSKKLMIGEESTSSYLLTKHIFIYKWNNNCLFFNAKKIEGHAHNDSLAVNLIINNKEVLLDAGTYSYNIAKEKRDYYRGRKSHNTIQISKKYDTIGIGTFRWLDKNMCYLSFIKESEEYIEIIGAIKNICTRRIKIDKKQNKIEIEDINKKEKRIETHWLSKKNSEIINQNIIRLENVNLEFEEDVIIHEEKENISKQYLEEGEANLYIVKKEKEKLNTVIIW